MYDSRLTVHGVGVCGPGFVLADQRQAEAQL